jgi:hypothetical protein
MVADLLAVIEAMVTRLDETDAKTTEGRRPAAISSGDAGTLQRSRIGTRTG